MPNILLNTFHAPMTSLRLYWLFPNLLRWNYMHRGFFSYFSLSYFDARNVFSRILFHTRWWRTFSANYNNQQITIICAVNVDGWVFFCCLRLRAKMRLVLEEIAMTDDAKFLFFENFLLILKLNDGSTNYHYGETCFRGPMLNTFPIWPNYIIYSLNYWRFPQSFLIFQFSPDFRRFSKRWNMSYKYCNLDL